MLGRHDRLCNQISANESRVWSAPARTLAGVLLHGEIALYNENGVMNFIDEANSYEDDRAIAQLIRAVVAFLVTNGHKTARLPFLFLK